MSICKKCNKEWGGKEKLEIPGTREKPVQGFHFLLDSKTEIEAWDENGDPIHPFDRPEMEIVSCPKCQRSRDDPFSHSLR